MQSAEYERYTARQRDISGCWGGMGWVGGGRQREDGHYMRVDQRDTAHHRHCVGV